MQGIVSCIEHHMIRCPEIEFFGRCLELCPQLGLYKSNPYYNGKAGHNLLTAVGHSNCKSPTHKTLSTKLFFTLYSEQKAKLFFTMKTLVKAQYFLLERKTSFIPYKNPLSHLFLLAVENSLLTGKGRQEPIYLDWIPYGAGRDQNRYPGNNCTPTSCHWYKIPAHGELHS